MFEYNGFGTVTLKDKSGKVKKYRAFLSKPHVPALSISSHAIVKSDDFMQTLVTLSSPLAVWCTWLTARLCHYSDNDRCGGSGSWNCSVTMRRGTAGPRGQATYSYLVQGGGRHADIQVKFYSCILYSRFPLRGLNHPRYLTPLC